MRREEGMNERYDKNEWTMRQVMVHREDKK